MIHTDKYKVQPIFFEKTNKSKGRTNVIVYLCHTGINLNNSIMPKEVINAAICSLNNLPICGLIKENGDFGGHEPRLIKDETTSEFRIISALMIFGVLPESCNPRWINKTIDGVTREYLCADGILYTGRYPKLEEIFLRDKSKYQSIELFDDVDGKQDKETGIFTFSQFSFDCACIIGNDKTPAMIGASVDLVNYEMLKNNVLAFKQSKSYFELIQKNKKPPIYADMIKKHQNENKKLYEELIEKHIKKGETK